MNKKPIATKSIRLRITAHRLNHYKRYAGKNKLTQRIFDVMDSASQYKAKG